MALNKGTALGLVGLVGGVVLAGFTPECGGPNDIIDGCGKAIFTRAPLYTFAYYTALACSLGVVYNLITGNAVEKRNDNEE